MVTGGTREASWDGLLLELGQELSVPLQWATTLLAESDCKSTHRRNEARVGSQHIHCLGDSR